MTMTVIDPLDLASAALLLVFHAALSVSLCLGIGRQLVIAALRMVVQLALIGLVLDSLFGLASPWWTGLTALAMVLFAGREVAARQTHRFRGLWTHGLGASTMLLAGGIVTALALTTQLRPDPWYDPRYVIPILGMVLGNTLTGVSVGLDRLLSTAARERVAIEARLALGHDRRAALLPVVRQACRAGLMPVVNSMSAMGIVFLPGMMTGQILAGLDPVEAVKYQILIMFLLAGAIGIGVLVSVFAAAWGLTDARHRLRLDRLSSGSR